jgi:hypothetical protein
MKNYTFVSAPDWMCLFGKAPRVVSKINSREAQPNSFSKQNDL